MNKALSFFSDAEKERIKEATRAVESKTVGEIAVMVVDTSTRYREGEILGAISLANIVAFLITVFFFHESLWWYIPFTLVFFIPSCLLFKKLPSVAIHFVGIRRKQLAVRDRAIRAFYERGLFRTKGATGILFLISLLERKVWVLADKGIHEKMTQAKLNGFAKDISAGIHEHQAAKTLIEAIHQAGDILAQHFPIHEKDLNELADTVLTGGGEE